MGSFYTNILFLLLVGSLGAGVFSISNERDPTQQAAQLGGVTAQIKTAIEKAQQAATPIPEKCEVAVSAAKLQQKPYLGNQLIQRVGGAPVIGCGVNNNEKVLVGGSTVCAAYPGPDGRGATLQCPTAVVELNDGVEKIICWNEGSSCGSADPQQTKATTEGEDIEDDLTKKLQENKPQTANGQKLPGADASFEEGVKVNADGDGFVAFDGSDVTFAELGWNSACIDDNCGWITKQGEFVTASQLRQMAGSDLSNISTVSTGGVVSGGNVVPRSNTPVSSNGTVPTVGNRASPPVGRASSAGNPQAPTPSGSGVAVPRSGNVGTSVTRGNAPTGSGVRNPGATTISTTPSSPYRSFQQPSAFRSQPQSFIQRFVGGNPLTDLANFVTGQAALRNTPEGQQGGQPKIIYVTSPTVSQPQRVSNNSLRSIQAIASDISAQTQGSNIPRVDRFAQTLEAVGGPNAINTENKPFGRIQDLIVEDEAIRALRIAEERGKRAKNSVFCGAKETADACQVRREKKAKEVERKVFIEELEKRVLPESAIQHFLAVYDGWVRPSPAPSTRATSTLAVLNAQNQDPLAQYEITTSGTNFVLWVIDSVAQATRNAVGTFVNVITGGSNKPTQPASSL